MGKQKSLTSQSSSSTRRKYQSLPISKNTLRMLKRIDSLAGVTVIGEDENGISQNSCATDDNSFVKVSECTDKTLTRGQAPAMEREVKRNQGLSECFEELKTTGLRTKRARQDGTNKASSSTSSSTSTKAHKKSGNKETWVCSCSQVNVVTQKAKNEEPMKCIFCDEYRNDANQLSLSNIGCDYEDPVSGNIYHSMNYLFNGMGSYRSEITGALHSARRKGGERRHLEIGRGNMVKAIHSKGR